ncbi:hypothetical protein PROFUN_00392 [Planoprotostelium fungivorum]|uniref:Uncharacterized protein n=1 Tax=Planoprotostelium fungivorum TaxID=1890364 RepID=A0A2P6NY92_9EUKA|nr:hypothetical protein PROFUN_00392 [Planoprotostelium fungivorum]
MDKPTNTTPPAKQKTQKRALLPMDKLTQKFKVKTSNRSGRERGNSAPPTRTAPRLEDCQFNWKSGGNGKPPSPLSPRRSEETVNRRSSLRSPPTNFEMLMSAAQHSSEGEMEEIVKRTKRSNSLPSSTAPILPSAFYEDRFPSADVTRTNSNDNASRESSTMDSPLTVNCSVRLPTGDASPQLPNFQQLLHSVQQQSEAEKQEEESYRSRGSLDANVVPSLTSKFMRFGLISPGEAFQQGDVFPSPTGDYNSSQYSSPRSGHNTPRELSDFAHLRLEQQIQPFYSVGMSPRNFSPRERGDNGSPSAVAGSPRLNPSGNDLYNHRLNSSGNDLYNHSPRSNGSDSPRHTLYSPRDASVFSSAQYNTRDRREGMNGNVAQEYRNVHMYETRNHVEGQHDGSYISPRSPHIERLRPPL